jgi:hypothetical protein
LSKTTIIERDEEEWRMWERRKEGRKQAIIRASTSVQTNYNPHITSFLRSNKKIVEKNDKESFNAVPLFYS